MPIGGEVPQQPTQPMQPVAPVPQQPVEPQPVMQQPQPAPQFTAPQQPTAAESPMGVSPVPQPQVFGAGPVMPQPAPARSSGKIIALIASLVAGLAIIGVGVWALLTFALGGISLETYEGKDYSVLVPKDYEKKEIGDSVTFTEPLKEGEESKSDSESTDRSVVMVGKTSLETITQYMSREDIIKTYDESLTEDKLKENSSITGKDGNDKAVNFKKTDDKYQGFEARKVTFDVESDGKSAGRASMLVVFTDKAIYSIMVAAHDSDASLQRAMDKIVNSLKINE
jgi:hypothetical protein